MFYFREATQADQAAIRLLVRSVRINPTNLDWRRFLVAVDEANTLIGCGQIKQHDRHTCELASIAVQPANRRQGVARALIEKLLKDSLSPGCEVYLTCRAELESFYKKFCFDRATGKLPAYFSMIRGLSRILLLFRLNRQAILVMHYRKGGST